MIASKAPWLWPPWSWRAPLPPQDLLEPTPAWDVQRLAFWLVVAGLLVVIALLSNPNDASFRSHLTELSFRRHLQDLHSDDEASGSRTPNPPPTDDEDPSPTPTAFRFANHVAISLRTPPYQLINLYICTLALTTCSAQAALSPPAPVKLNKKRERLKSVGVASVHFGCLGSWWAVGNVPGVLEGIVGFWIPMKVEKTVAPGVLDCKAVISDDVRSNGKIKSLKDSIGSLEHAGLSLPLHSTPSTPEKQSIPLPTPQPVTPSPLSQSDPAPQDLPSSPLLTSLNAELAAAQAVVTDLHSQLSSLDETLGASQAHLQSNVDELRSRRKEDDHERAELKSKTKTLEEQKRTAEGAKRESEKKLRAAEALRDAVLSRIKGMKGDMDRMREKMLKADKGQVTQLDDLARHKEDVKGAVADKNQELKNLEREVLRLEAGNEEIDVQVKEAEEKLKAVLEYGEQARKLFQPDDHVHPSLQWGNQAAANYLPDSFNDFPHHYPRQQPYRNELSELTAASLGRLTADVSGFEDFGPAPHEREPPGSPTGTISSSFTATDLIPQGLFRSLEGDATPVEVKSYDGDEGSASDDSDDEFHNASPGEHRRQASASASHSTLQPSPAPPPPARRWFSPRSNGTLAFQHPSGSSDSLGTTSGPYEASPFAPSASEKKALRWGPISKYRWAGVNRSADDLASGTAADIASSSTPDLWAQQQEQEQQQQQQGKQPFRFFSLRKPSAGVWN